MSRHSNRPSSNLGPKSIMFSSDSRESEDLNPETLATKALDEIKRVIIVFFYQIRQFYQHLLPRYCS